MVTESEWKRNDLLRQIDQFRGHRSREEYMRNLMDDLDHGREMPPWYPSSPGGHSGQLSIGRHEFDEFRHEMRSILKDLIDYVVPGEEQATAESEPGQSRFRKAVASHFQRKRIKASTVEEEAPEAPTPEAPKAGDQKPSRLRIYYGKPGIPGSRVEEVTPVPRAKGRPQHAKGQDEDEKGNAGEEPVTGSAANPQLDRLAQLMEQMLANQQTSAGHGPVEAEEGAETEEAPRPKKERAKRPRRRHGARRSSPYDDDHRADRPRWEDETFAEWDWHGPPDPGSAYGYPPLPQMVGHSGLPDNMAFAAMDSIQRNLELLSHKMTRLERQRNVRSPPAPSLPPIFEYLEKPSDGERVPPMGAYPGLPGPASHPLPYPQQTMLVMGPNGQVMQVPVPPQPGHSGHSDYPGHPGQPAYQGLPGSYPAQGHRGVIPPQLPSGPVPTGYGPPPAHAGDMASALKEATRQVQQANILEVEPEMETYSPEEAAAASSSGDPSIIMPASMGGGAMSGPAHAATPAPAADDEMPADGIIMPGSMSKPALEAAGPPPEQLPEADAGQVVMPDDDAPPSVTASDFPADGIIMPGGNDETPSPAPPVQEDMPADGIIMPQGMNHASSNHGAYVNANHPALPQIPRVPPPELGPASLTPYDPLTTPEDELDGFISALRSSGQPFDLPEGQPVPPPLPEVRVTPRKLKRTLSKNLPRRASPTRILEARVERPDPYPRPEERPEADLEAFMDQVETPEKRSRLSVPEPDPEPVRERSHEHDEEVSETEAEKELLPPDEEVDLPPWKTQFDALWVGAFLMFGLGDIFSTWWAISNGAIEANPFLHNIVHDNFTVFVLIKIILMMVAFLYSYVVLMENGHDARFMPAVFILAGTYLVVNNYMVVKNLQNGILAAA